MWPHNPQRRNKIALKFVLIKLIYAGAGKKFGGSFGVAALNESV